MTVVAFYEPSYVRDSEHVWQLRGGYKYPSVLDAIANIATPLLAMDVVPPESDPVRLELERKYGAVFVEVPRRLQLQDARDAFGIAANLAGALSTYKPDIVSNLNGRKLHWCYGSALAAEKLNAEYVYRVGGNDIATELAVCDGELRPFLGTKRYWEAVERERLVVARARTVIVMSPQEKNRVSMLSTNPDRIRVCPRGVNTDIFSPREYPRSLGRLLFVGRNSYEKGFDLLLSTFKQLAPTHPDLELMVAGPFETGKKENVTYLGVVPTSELPRLYASVDSVVLCSRTEGMPQVIMEAMASGRACILSRHLFDEVFVHGEEVLLTSLEISELRNHIVTLYENPPLVGKLARAARNFAKTNFAAYTSLERYRDALLGVEHD